MIQVHDFIFKRRNNILTTILEQSNRQMFMRSHFSILIIFYFIWFSCQHILSCRFSL